MSSCPEHGVRFPVVPRILRCGTQWTWNLRPGDPVPTAAREPIEREAFERGRAEERRRLSAAHDALRAARERMIELEHERQATLEPEVVELALHVAERIVGETVRQGRHDVRRLVADALRGLRGVEDERTVHLHPRDLELLRETGIATDDGLVYRADPEVPRGSCRVATAYGTIVRDVDLLLREVGTRLRAQAARRHERLPTSDGGDA